MSVMYAGTGLKQGFGAGGSPGAARAEEVEN